MHCNKKWQCLVANVQYLLATEWYITVFLSAPVLKRLNILCLTLAQSDLQTILHQFQLSTILRIAPAFMKVFHQFQNKCSCCFSHWNSEIDYKQFTIYQNDLHVCGSTQSISPEMSLCSTPLISPEICLPSLPLKYWNRL